ncbi:MAG: heat-inducible transcriptional repressor HrcA [Defluviitaleaceae bacterium]|nr:heat-inducible transcriptional repressor HrcA [Defluviitaleaceae bacterium]
MLLNDRKIRILEAIINDYIQSAEPIGSRTIAKKYGMGISSATIRNEMSDLEEMGLIIQPHASAGRIPSDKGYRLYVDRLMRRRGLTDEEALYLQHVITDNISQVDYLMQETAKAIAMLTKCTTVVTEPRVKRTVIRHAQLVPVDDTSFVLVLVTGSKVVKNHLLYVENAPDYETLQYYSAILNSVLAGQSVDEDGEIIDRATLAKLTEQFGNDKRVLDAVLKAARSILNSEDEIHVYTSGVRNILGFPEFSDIEKAKEIFEALEEKDMLITMLGQDSSEDIQIIIGEENNLEQLRGCSIIKADYRAGTRNFGSIGVIGPTRMDYGQAVSVLDGIVKKISAVIKALSGG